MSLTLSPSTTIAGGEVGDPQKLPAGPPQQSLVRQDNPPALKRWRKWSLFGCSCLLLFLLQFDMASVAVALPVRTLADQERLNNKRR